MNSLGWLLMGVSVLTLIVAGIIQRKEDKKAQKISTQWMGRAVNKGLFNPRR